MDCDHAVPPGGDLPPGETSARSAGLSARYPALAGDWLARLVRRHGLCAAAILGDAEPADLGESFG